MLDDTPANNKKERNDTTIGINEKLKERLSNLDFVKKHSYGNIIEILMDFYETHKPSKTEFEKWLKKLMEKKKQK